MRFKLLFILLFVALAFGRAPASAAQDKNPGPRTFRLLSLAGSYGGLFYQMNANTKLLKVSLDQGLSSYYFRPPGSTLEIFREFPVPPDSPPGTKPIRKAGLIATIPENVSRCIIATIPNSNRRTDLLTTFVIPDDSQDHHAGTMLFANFSSFPAMVALDKEIYPLAVGESRVINYPPGASEFIAQIALKKNNAWKPVYKSEFSINYSHRGYIIFADYVQDPDYKASAIPPPASVTAVFEMSPEVPVHLVQPNHN